MKVLSIILDLAEIVLLVCIIKELTERIKK